MKKMQGLTIVAMVLVAGSMLMTGCPDLPVDPPVDNPPVAETSGYFAMPIDLLGDGSKSAFSDEELALIGQRYLDLQAAKTGKSVKAISNEELIHIGQAFILEADSVCAYLYPSGKGGGAAITFCSGMKEGYAFLDSRDSDTYIPVGVYDLYVAIYFNGYLLFSGKPAGGLVTIQSGQNSTQVEFNFLDGYWIECHVGNLPTGLVPSSVELISAFYPQSTSCFLGQDGLTHFSLNGQVQFTGGVLVFLDDLGRVIKDPATGNPYAMDLPIDIAEDYGRGVFADYAPSSNIGSLEVSPAFAFMTHILVNGEIVDNAWDLPNAIFNAGSEVEVYVPKGDFYPGNPALYLPANSRISIRGEGIESRLHGCIRMTTFSPAMGKGDAKGGYANGLTLENLFLVQDQATFPEDGFPSTALFLGGEGYLHINDCVVVSWKDAIIADYVDSVEINQSVVMSGNYVGVQFLHGNPESCSIRNTVFERNLYAICFDAGEPIVSNCGFYNNMKPGNVDLSTSLVDVNPLWAVDPWYNPLVSPFTYLPGSPYLIRSIGILAE
ncbi:MAG: hypothetical protein WC244_00020 [Patescibacteria group bacterium]|jgi:hypothetical protein